MLRIPLPEYTDGTLRKLTAIRELIPLSLGLFCPFVPSRIELSRLHYKAQSRHRGARSAMASAMRDLCKIAALAKNILTVLRRGEIKDTKDFNDIKNALCKSRV